MKINHISISREQTFKECNQKYKFKYDLKVIPEGPEPIYFTFGKIVHRILEEFTKCRGEVLITKITKDILTGNMDLDPGIKSPPLDVEHKNKLTKHLNHFLRLTEKIGFDGEVEWKFNIDLDGHGRYLTGVIDRIIQKNNEFFLIDYKTTKPSPWRKNSRNITKDLQLMCYCYVVWKEFKVNPKNIQACLFYLDDNKIVPVRFSEKTLSTVPERLLKVYKIIEDMPSDTVCGNLGNWCHRCEYKKVCPHFSIYELK